MHEQFLDLLCCPHTHEPLRLEAGEVQPNGVVLSGKLVSPSGREYLIVKGIPRFVSDELYAANFGFEWKRWPRLQFEDQNIGGPMEGHTTRMWEIATGIREQDLRGRTFIEFGCGAGRFLDVIRRRGGLAVGMDLSLAVEVARDNFPDDPDVLIVQGDVFEPPFHEAVFDVGFAFGVLEHTPDPLRGLEELARTVRPEGTIACIVYQNKGYYASRSVARARWLMNWLKPVLGYRPAILYSYFSGYVLEPTFRLLNHTPFRLIVSLIEKNCLPCLHVPDRRWRVLDTFDSITPVIVSHHTGEEVRDWFDQVGCKNVYSTKWGPTSVVGVKARSG